MSTLGIPGARLHFEVEGTGPLLVLVPGAAGVAEVFRPLAQHLAARHTVLRYDRRGFGRSQPTGPPDDRPRLAADDVHRLIEHAAPDGRATVFGSSSGAIVAIAALLEHPETVTAVIAHEPPLIWLLPDAQQRLDVFHQMYEVYRREGTETAMTAFRHRTFPPSYVDAMAHAPKHPGDARFWFEQELRQYPGVELDLDALRGLERRVRSAAGRISGAFPCRWASAALAAADRTLLELPGGRIGFLTGTAAFADQLGDHIAGTAPSTGGAR